MPQHRKHVSDVLAEEGIVSCSAAECDQVISRIGIEHIHACGKESSSDLAFTAAKHAIEQSKISPDEIDMIVDFTSLPEDYVVPSWSMANKLQHDLGAKKAFTIGFSGGGSSNLLVALKFTASLLQTDPGINTALLIAGERSVAGKRILGLPDVVTVCGDGASALIVSRSNSENQQVLGTALWTAGEMHNVLRIPAGGFVQPADYEDYKLVLDKQRYDAYLSRHSRDVFSRLADELLNPLKLNLSQIKYFICPNISIADRRSIAGMFGVDVERIADGKLRTYGHVQSSDFVINYISAVSAGSIAPGDYILFCSHGFGFTWGMAVLRY